jgi:hypothetical protein
LIFKRDDFELRDKDFARKFQVQSAKEAFKAEVSPTRHTRHTRRTRPTPQLNSSAKLHQSDFNATFKREAPLPLRIHPYLGTIMPLEGRMANGRITEDRTASWRL